VGFSGIQRRLSGNNFCSIRKSASRGALKIAASLIKFLMIDFGACNG
jgi:hypothetical protein